MSMHDILKRPLVTEKGIAKKDDAKLYQPQGNAEYRLNQSLRSLLWRAEPIRVNPIPKGSPYQSTTLYPWGL